MEQKDTLLKSGLDHDEKDCESFQQNEKNKTWRETKQDGYVPF